MQGERIRSRRPRRAWIAIPLALLAAFAALVGVVASLTELPPETRGASASARVVGAPPVAGGLAGPPPMGAGPGAVASPMTRDSAEAHLAMARQLLERNRADAPGATKAELLQAEVEVLAALRQELTDPSAAWALVADLNGAMASDWAGDDQERRWYRQREREALRGLLELDPGDGEARYRYAMLIEERGWRIEELTRAAGLTPRDHRPRRALGEDLLEAGRPDEGARLLVEAAELCDREELGHQGPDIVHLLRYHGREQEEARIRELMERLGY